MQKFRRFRKVAWALIQETVLEWQKDKASNLAAALAYYTIFSITPLLVIVIAIAGFFYGEAAVQGEIINQLQDLVGQDGASIIQTTLKNIQTSNRHDSLSASAISVAILLFGSTSTFAQLQESLNIIWAVKPGHGQGLLMFIKTRLLSFSMVIGIVFLLLVSLVVSTILSTVSHAATGALPGFALVWRVLHLGVSFGVITLLFAMIYKFLPDALIHWQDVWIGAAMTTLLFIVGKSLLGLYLGQSSFSSTDGAAGSLVIFVAWVYYSAQILFFGAEFTQVYARHYGSTIISASTH